MSAAGQSPVVLLLVLLLAWAATHAVTGERSGIYITYRAAICNRFLNITLPVSYGVAAVDLNATCTYARLHAALLSMCVRCAATAAAPSVCINQHLQMASLTHQAQNTSIETSVFTALNLTKEAEPMSKHRS